MDKLRWTILVVALTWNFWSVCTLDFPNFELGELSARLEKGREEINKLQQKAMLPKGTCWKSALEELQVSCKDMVPELQSRLALKFTMCYNILLGFPPVICEKRTPVQECMKSLDIDSKSTFRDFFLHTQDMCYFIEHQLWQEKTNDAVNVVTNAVVDVNKNLEVAKETQEKVLHSQQESLKVQSDIIKDNSILHSLVLNVKDVFQDVQTSAMEQRQVFIEIFDKLSRMQKLVSWIQGEMSLLDMMGFYFTCIVFGFFATASQRTQKARFWIVVLMIVSLGLERFMYNQLNEKTNLSPEAIQDYIWILRRIAAVFGVVIIVCFAACYRDPQKVQQNMIEIVNKRLDQILAHINEDKLGIQGKEKDMLKVKGLEEDSLNLSDSDAISIVNSDSETDELEIPQSKRSEPSSNFNDENKIPETDPSFLKQIYKRVRKNTKNLSRADSADRSTLNRSTHQYNLRGRNTSVSPSEVDSSFSKKPMVKKPMASAANRRSMYFSSDED